jgi:hypothetical protein
MNELEEWLSVGIVLILVVIAAVLFDSILHNLWGDD